MMGLLSYNSVFLFYFLSINPSSYFAWVTSPSPTATTTTTAAVIPCANPAAAPDATFSPVSGPYVEGDTVTYTCSTGYAKTAGDLVHTCTSGAWTGTLPTCSILTCVPASVPNSSKSPDQATYDYATSVTYSCTTGYEHTGGDLTRTCQADTTWSGTTPACSLITCVPASVPNSSKSPDQATYDYATSVTYSCTTGYEHTGGDLTRTCQADTTWSGTTPACSLITCVPASVPNSSKSPDQATYDYATSVTYSCTTGYEHTGGDLTRTCQADTTWSGTTPTCSIITCVPASVPNSSKSPDQATYDYATSVTYSCTTGYEHTGGDLTRTCQADTTWSGTTPTCSIITCVPASVPNSSKSPDQPTYDYATSVTYSCTTGYEHTGGDLTRTCQADTTWSGTTPTCSIITCVAASVPNSSKSPDQATYDYATSVTYSCTTGYEHTGGDLTRTCQADTTWSGNTPTCSIVTCVPASVPNSSKSPDQATYDYATSVTYSCTTGYEHTGGDLTRTCQADTMWSGTTPTCSIITCVPASVPNSSKSPDQATYDYATSVTYSCNTGYEHTGGDLTRTCQADTMWSGTTPTCSIITCVPASVPNSSKSPDQATYDYATSVTYSCTTGYEHTGGDLTRTCQADTTWSGTTPTCSIITCGAPANAAFATYTAVQASYIYSESVTYVCDTGYWITAGDVTRTCTVGSVFTGTPPTCTYITCGAPTPISFGAFTPVQATYNYGEAVTYTCDTGYEPFSGDFSRACSDGFLWSGDDPVCTIKTCAPAAVPSSSKSPDQVSYDYATSVTYNCLTGYIHSAGDLTRTCQADTTWSGTTPTCSMITCVPSADVPNSTKDTAQGSYNYGDTVTYTCDTTYQMTSGTATRTCNNPDTWSGTLPTCTLITCSTAPALGSFVSMTTTAAAMYYHGDQVVHECITGYEVVSGTATRTCVQIESWDGTELTCTIKQCDKIAVSFAAASPDQAKYDYATSVAYTCFINYNHTAGDLTRTCDDTPAWDGSLPTCTIAACLPPPTTTMGTFAPTETIYQFGTNATYTCTVGYYISAGDDTLDCQNDGTWLGTAPTCSLVRCSTEAVGNATFTPNVALVDYNNAVTYTCDLAYNHTFGDLTRTCQPDFSWSGSTPVCTRSACIQEDSTYMTSIPDQVLHNFGGIIDYTCNLGYNHSSGDVNRTCLPSGLWSGVLPDCVIITCLVPDAPSYSSISSVATEVNYNTSITYTCDLGYNRTSGDATRRCTELATFEGTESTCTIITCAPPPDVAFATYTPVEPGGEHNYSTTVTYACDKGYWLLSGDLAHTCNEFADWTDVTPVCTIVTCLKPTESYITFSPNTATYDFNTTVTGTCVIGYNHTDGDKTRTCQNTFDFDGSPMICTIITCLVPDAPSYSSISSVATEVNYNTSITYTCDLGYNRTNGDATRRCTELATFEGTESTCTIITCAPPPDVAFATYTPVEPGGEHNYSTTVTYACDNGYWLLSGDLTHTCNEFADWTDVTPVCTIVTCPKPTESYITFSPNTATYDFNTTVTGTCVIGYNHTDGDKTRTCQNTFDFDGSPMICTIKECLTPDPVDHTSITNAIPANYVYLNTITYACVIGYELSSGDLTRTCQDSTAWSGSAPNCTIKICTPPPTITFGSYDPVEPSGEHEYNTIVNYTCDFGYHRLSGDPVRTCDDNKQWTGTTPVCQIVTCPKPTESYITYTPDTATYDFNTTVSGACILGYNHTAGDATRTCLNTFDFDGMPMICIIVECAALPLPAHSSITNTVPSKYVYQDDVTYACNTGYELSGGDVVRTCTETSFWDGTEPNCTIIYCPPPSAGTRNTYSPVLTEHVWLSNVTYTCDYGYEHFSGDMLSRCQDDKTWSAVIPVCTIVKCNKIDVSFMTFTPPTAATHDFNTTIVYSCVIGYNHSEGDLVRTCNASGYWTGITPACTIITCDPPPTLPHANYTPFLVEHDWNTAITYTCEEDYHYLGGSYQSVCNESGSFPPSDLNCSAPHFISLAVGEPLITWLNATVPSTVVTYDFDGYCDVTLTQSPPNKLTISRTLAGNQIQLNVAKKGGTAPGVYTISMSAFRGTRTFTGETREVFVGQEVKDLQASVVPDFYYVAVGPVHAFQATVTTGTDVTCTWVIDGDVISNYHAGFFSQDDITYTFTRASENISMNCTNYISSDSVDIPISAIYALNGQL
ncbi:sushi, von Willebrand factor type A, EGF and pentraxin domain-containing protein 1-like [Mya arenaria]|uniref:sushi, von Willebrand factor type A, EGF and pentraxin domain-containing protein 1-like n=1 Tax=Mya arenaria TaxID=6604 RepID=UPI0022DF65DE|nr:sushi, von Willebrand factor type A, EGF and pentraxin domain-containing protein 1-like [Mya arenaria]